MTLNRLRVRGIVFTTIGVVLAIIASLILTTQVRTGGSLLLGGLVGFVVVAPFMFVGAYFFWRGSTAELELNEEMPVQRELMDILRTHPTSLAELTAKLKLPTEEVLNIIHQLHTLDLFHGYITPEQQIIYVEINTIRNLTRCAVCSTGLNSQPGHIITCPGCKTDYYL